MIRIPLDTKYDYFACDKGLIYRDINGKKVRMRGYKNKPIRSNKKYLRYKFVMKDGTQKQFYGQRLVAFAFHGLVDGDGRIVRHLTDDQFNNAPDKIIPGTHEENQTIDRIQAGNYFKRGNNKDSDCPF